MTHNDEIATEVARKKARKFFRPEYAANEDYQFSVFMLILAQVHFALAKHRLAYPDGLYGEMKNCSAIIRHEMQKVGFVIEEPPSEDVR